MTNRPFNILVLCTGNSARSVMAEVLLNHLGRGRVRAFSAGSRPTGRVNPLTIATLAEMGHATDGVRSKSWEEFATPDAPAMDMVVTVCDNAAGEACPVWPGHPARLHLGFPDPAAAQGDDAARMAEFRRVYRMIEAEMRRLLATLETDR